MSLKPEYSIKYQQLEENQSDVNPRSSSYLCKMFKPGKQFYELQTFIMKRIAYRKKIEVDETGRRIYNDPSCKNFQQINTEYHCLTLLEGSHRVLRLNEVIHQNTKAKDDNRFFYNWLRLSDRRSDKIRNICFILEQMNEGSLKQQIEKIHNKQQQPFTQQKILEYTCQIAEGLKQLKKKGVIHRDLRPQNILIHNGQIKFSDFGSAFIKGYSSYENVKTGIDLRQTTPLQIMLLVAESDQNLQAMTDEQLWKRQQLADIYFLGVNIYTMIFCHPFQSFNGGRILSNLANIKKRAGFNRTLLDLMQKCLQKNYDNHKKRINLEEVISILKDAERQTYMKNSNYIRTYLSQQPLNLYSFSSNQLQAKLQSQNDKHYRQIKNNKKEMNERFKTCLEDATVERHTERYRSCMKEVFECLKDEMDKIWVDNERSRALANSRAETNKRIQQFLIKLNLRAYYYEHTYRIIREIDLKNLDIHTNKENIRVHLDMLGDELVVLLNFIYEMMVKSSFTLDKHYVDDKNYTYQNRQLLLNMRNLHSRRQFFSGRKKLLVKEKTVELLKKKLKQFQKQNPDSPEIAQTEQGIKQFQRSSQKISQLQRQIQQFNAIKYDTEDKKQNFWYQYQHLMQTLDRMQIFVRQEMVQTIVSLILAHEEIKRQPWGHKSNLKNVIFMLMILEAQNTKTTTKSDQVVVKQLLSHYINHNLGWKQDQLESFFSNYTQTHRGQVQRGIQELQSQAILSNSKIPGSKNLIDKIAQKQNDTPDQDIIPDIKICENPLASDRVGVEAIYKNMSGQNRFVDSMEFNVIVDGAIRQDNRSRRVVSLSNINERVLVNQLPLRQSMVVQEVTESFWN